VEKQLCISFPYLIQQSEHTVSNARILLRVRTH
jgi:hypothetical protein